MRHTNDSGNDQGFEDEGLPSFLEHGTAQPQRSGGKPEYKQKKFPKRGAAPTSYNGIHRRRKKRVMW